MSKSSKLFPRTVDVFFCLAPSSKGLFELRFERRDCVTRSRRFWVKRSSDCLALTFGLGLSSPPNLKLASKEPEALAAALYPLWDDGEAPKISRRDLIWSIPVEGRCGTISGGSDTETMEEGFAGGCSSQSEKHGEQFRRRGAPQHKRKDMTWQKLRRSREFAPTPYLMVCSRK